jgi:flagellar motor switch protein FliN
MADDNLVSQSEIERLLSQSRAPQPDPAAASPSSPSAAGVEASPGAGPSSAPANSGGPGAQTPHAAQSPQSAGTTTDDGKLLGQNDIEQLLSQMGKKPQPAAAKPSETREATAAATMPEEGVIAPKDIEYLFNQAEQALASVAAEDSGEAPPGVSEFSLEEFAGASASTENTTIDLIRDVDLDLKIELGRTHMYLEDVLRLRKGSVVPLDKLAGDPVDIYVNGRLIARGEVLVLNDNFCVRVAELIAGAMTGG